MIQENEPWVLDYENHSTDETVHFRVKVSEETMFDAESNKDLLYSKMKLMGKISLTNLHLYNSNGTIQKYKSIYQIMDEHFYTRLNMYKKRKEYQIDKKKIQNHIDKKKIQNHIDKKKIQNI